MPSDPSARRAMESADEKVREAAPGRAAFACAWRTWRDDLERASSMMNEEGYLDDDARDLYQIAVDEYEEFAVKVGRAMWNAALAAALEKMPTLAADDAARSDNCENCGRGPSYDTEAIHWALDELKEPS